ncbi:chemotaxis protein CheW [Hyalangium rubrum]|uniref:histidine kinase n=1 Tax=Hyalangium rubrum TaxID=3103134 RepID=A0ABU5GY47_9BACT|nr:chemotaxis protein CheW [Hyalangium sp. s54d21]MDY7225462.1 chemotaxis protein CheW [Hyalangium sp. s54d21]
MAPPADESREEILREFLLESRENLDQFEAGLLRLETEPVSPPLLTGLFRNLHTVKGTCGFLGFTGLEALTHASEDLLQLAREGQLTLDTECLATLLATVDTARQVIQHIETTGSEGTPVHGSLLARLQRLRKGGLASPLPSSTELVLPTSGAAETKVRVDVALLDRMMNLVGELVLSRNQLLQSLSTATSGADLSSGAHRLSLVTTELQEVVMKTRLQPIGNVWNRFPRLVRDLAHACGKQVRLKMEGADTELDKTLLEAVMDPLTHLLRNAIDHGLEAPAQRVAQGKEPVGCVTLQAYHESGMVNVELSDDGAGIDPQRILQRAMELRLVTAEQAATLSDREALAFLFAPGFSTAERVTSLSGRGVGMDVVKVHIEKIGGTVDIHSRPGQGTTVKLKIPLTLAIIPALIVTCRNERFAIPQASLLEVVRLEGEQVRRHITSLQGSPVFRLRDRLLPLAWLSRELKLAAEIPAALEEVSIVVLQAGERTFGLVVDAINDTEEIVVKPLWKRLKAITCYAGATVLGDGRVALILDALGLGQRVGVVNEAREQLVGQRTAAPEAREERERVLLCRNGPEGQLAILLSRVSRLEKLPASRVEHIGAMEVVQYRGQLLPLVRVAAMLQERRRQPRHPSQEATAEEEEFSVIVCAHGETHVGLVVDAIQDVVEVKVELQRHSRRAGVLGSMVVQGRATEFLDVEGLVRAALPSLVAGLAAPLDRSA